MEIFLILPKHYDVFLYLVEMPKIPKLFFIYIQVFLSFSQMRLRMRGVSFLASQTTILSRPSNWGTVPLFSEILTLSVVLVRRLIMSKFRIKKGVQRPSY